ADFQVADGDELCGPTPSCTKVWALGPLGTSEVLRKGPCDDFAQSVCGPEPSGNCGACSGPERRCRRSLTPGEVRVAKAAAGLGSTSAAASGPAAVAAHPHPGDPVAEGPVRFPLSGIDVAAALDTPA